MKWAAWATAVWMAGLSMAWAGPGRDPADRVSTDEQFGVVGLGVAQLYDSKVDNRAGSLVVLDVIPGSSAAAQGVEKGDVITHIEGRPTAGKNIDVLVLHELRGRVGTRVKITIKRSRARQPIALTLTRTAMMYQVPGPDQP